MAAADFMSIASNKDRTFVPLPELDLRRDEEVREAPADQ